MGRIAAIRACLLFRHLRKPTQRVDQPHLLVRAVGAAGRAGVIVKMLMTIVRIG